MGNERESERPRAYEKREREREKERERDREREREIEREREMILDDRRKIGLGLTGFGVFFMFLGALFFFDRGFLAMGNLLFLSGVTMLIGAKSAIRFFSRKRSRRGSVAFFLGFALVLWGWPMIGLGIESYGIFLLFAGFLPTILMFLKKFPALGSVLDKPWIKKALNKVAPANLPV